VELIGTGMIGWALRWVLLCCFASVLLITVTHGGHWLPALDKTASAPIVSAAIPAEPALPAGVNTLVYPADERGHVILDAVVNGAPVRFLVDTGASYVTLTSADAQAAGLNPRQLAFNQRASTANGEVRIATVSLREIRLGQLTVTDVPAAVIENLKLSLLGMSLLRRLQSYEMHDGKLTISW
jgi:aspartyl protease family protein